MLIALREIGRACVGRRAARFSYPLEPNRFQVRAAERSVGRTRQTKSQFAGSPPRPSSPLRSRLRPRREDDDSARSAHVQYDTFRLWARLIISVTAPRAHVFVGARRRRYEREMDNIAPFFVYAFSHTDSFATAGGRRIVRWHDVTVRAGWRNKNVTRTPNLTTDRPPTAATVFVFTG